MGTTEGSRSCSSQGNAVSWGTFIILTIFSAPGEVLTPYHLRRKQGEKHLYHTPELTAAFPDTGLSPERCHTQG